MSVISIMINTARFLRNFRFEWEFEYLFLKVANCLSQQKQKKLAFVSYLYQEIKNSWYRKLPEKRCLAVTFQIGIRKHRYWHKTRLGVMRLLTIYFFYSGFFQMKISTKKIPDVFLVVYPIFLQVFFSAASFFFDLFAVSSVDTPVDVSKTEQIIKLSGFTVG